MFPGRCGHMFLNHCVHYQEMSYGTPAIIDGCIPREVQAGRSGEFVAEESWLFWSLGLTCRDYGGSPLHRLVDKHTE
jgi:hypothetical protein